MFKNDFQGGPFFEVFSAQSKDPVSHWKLSGSSFIKRVYEKEVRSYIFSLEGNGATTKMQLPKDSRQALNLVQRYLVLQIFIHKGSDCSLNFGVTDMGNNKRRILLSTAHKDIQPNPLHVQLPLALIKRSKWLNLCFDLQSIVNETWRGQTHKSLDSICVSAHCKLRRIFTMKTQPQDNTDDDGLYELSECTNKNVDTIPKQCQLAADVGAVTQVITMLKLRYYDWKSKGGDVSHKPPSGLEIDLDSSGGKKASTEPYHIAFGTKVQAKKGRSKDGSQSSRNTSRSKLAVESGGKPDQPSPGTSRRNSGDDFTPRERKNSDPGANQEDPEITVDKGSMRTSHTWTDGVDNRDQIPFVHVPPHPPREPSSEGRRRRKPRVKSAGKDGQPSIVVTTEPGSAWTGSRGSNASSISSQGTSEQPSTVADDDEVESIMRAMRQDVSGSETDSPYISTTNEGDDSLTEVISALNAKTRLRDDSIGSYESSDDSMYTFSSRPVPLHHQRHSPNNVAQSKSRERRRKHKSSSSKQSGAGSKPAIKLKQKEPADEDSSGEEGGSTLTFNSTQIPNVTLKAEDKEGKESEQPSPVKNKLLEQVPHLPEHMGSSVGSQSRMSISRKALREIPKDDVRLSQGKQKPYDSKKYQMVELSESFEAKMLQQLKEEAMEAGSEEEDEKPRQREAGRDQQGGGISHLQEYGNHSSSDSSDDNSMATPKSQPAPMAHHYHDEMKLAPHPLRQDFSLSQSNPRDWSNIYSPPIVMPGDMRAPQVGPMQLPTKQHYGFKQGSRGPESDGEEELDLLYDPCLNCYFDPKSCKYYELV